MDRLDELLAPKPKPSTIGTLAYILFGLIMWSIQLTVIYGGHTLVCSQGGTAVTGDWLVWITSIVTGAVVLVFLLAPSPFARLFGLTHEMEDRRVYDRFAFAIALLSEIAIVWAGLTALVVEACAQGR